MDGDWAASLYLRLAYPGAVDDKARRKEALEGVKEDRAACGRSNGLSVAVASRYIAEHYLHDRSCREFLGNLRLLGSLSHPSILPRARAAPHHILFLGVFLIGRSDLRKQYFCLRFLYQDLQAQACCIHAGMMV